MFEVTSTREDNRTVVEVRGEVDAATCDQLAAVLDDSIAASGIVELDVRAVSFIDSSGLRALVQADQHLGEGRCLILRGPDATFRRLLQITGLDKRFVIE